MSDKKIPNEVLAVLSRCTADDGTAAVYLPPEQLDRKLYVAVDRVLKGLGGKWTRGLGGHVFSGQPSVTDLLDSALLSGTYDCPKLDGFFETPADIANVMAYEAVVKTCAPADGFILEPSAGRGALVRALVTAGWPARGIRCCEIRENNRAALYEAGYNMVGTDFLNYSDAPHGIVMNPPFARKADVHHVEHALDLLEMPGRALRGPLRAIMSAGIKFREDAATRNLRDRIHAFGGEIDDLREGAFKQAGTNVRTVLVRV